MKKLAKHLIEKLPPAKIYREDIEDIYNIFEEVSSEIRIEAEGFRFDNLDELFSYSKDKINSLSLLILKHDVIISFNPDSIWLHSMNDTSIQVGLFEKIKSIVKKRRNWAFLLTTNPVLSSFCAGISFVTVSYYIVENELQDLTNFTFIFRVFILLVCVVWFFYGLKISFKKYSQIFLLYKKSETSFLERNRDNIIISTIFLILSIVTAYLLK